MDTSTDGATASAIIPALPVDAAGRLDLDLACVACGYNLRGLAPEGTCPECGASVARATEQAWYEHLRFADPRWLAGMARGFALILLGLGFGGAMLGVLAALAWSMPDQRTANLLAWALALPPGWVIFIGCWLITRPVPGEPGPRAGQPARARVAARLMASAVAALATLTGPAFLLDEVLAGILVLLGLLVTTVGAFAALVHGRRLARRLPHPKLAGWTRAATIGYAAVTAALTGAIGVAVLAVATPTQGQRDALVLAAILGALVPLGLGLLFPLTLGLLVWYRVRFAALARAAAE